MLHSRHSRLQTIPHPNHSPTIPQPATIVASQMLHRDGRDGSKTIKNLWNISFGNIFRFISQRMPLSVWFNMFWTIQPTITRCILDTCQKIYTYHYISVLIAVHISTFHILHYFTIFYHILRCFTLFYDIFTMFYHILKYVIYIALPYFYTILQYFSICLPYVYYIVAICSPYFNTFYNVLPYIYNLFYHMLHYFSIFLPYVNHIFTIFLPHVTILKHNSWYLTSRLTHHLQRSDLGVNVLTLPIALPPTSAPSIWTIPGTGWGPRKRAIAFSWDMAVAEFYRLWCLW